MVRWAVSAKTATLPGGVRVFARASQQCDVMSVILDLSGWNLVADSFGWRFFQDVWELVKFLEHSGGTGAAKARKFAPGRGLSRARQTPETTVIVWVHVALSRSVYVFHCSVGLTSR